MILNSENHRSLIIGRVFVADEIGRASVAIVGSDDVVRTVMTVYELCVG